MNVIFRKIKEKGFLWLIARVRQELRAPSNKSVKTVIDFLLRARKRMPRLVAQVNKDEFLYCVYDLNICDLTYVMGLHLIDFELEARKKNKEGFILVIVPSSLDPNLVWQEYDSVVNNDSKLWRFQNVVLPLTFLSPYCRGTYVLPRRSDAIALSKTHEVYPDLYDGINLRRADTSNLIFERLDRPTLFEGLKANTQGIKYVKDWMYAKGIKSRVVTITIRDYDFDRARNSDTEAWSSFVRYLLKAGYTPVVIPDTDNSFNKNSCFEGATFFTECAWNMGLRIALYESAYLNFFVPNGCATLAIFNPRCSYITMNMHVEGAIVTNEEIYKEFNQNYKFANHMQRICFKPDTYENIRTEFDRFVKDNPPVNSIVDI